MSGLLKRLRRLFFVLLIGLLATSALTRIVSASLGSLPDGPVGEATAPMQPLDEAATDEIAGLLRDISRRSQELDQRELDLALREQDIAVARQEIEAALARLSDAEDRLAARMQQSSSAADTDIDQLVRVYEGMKPKDAATLFEEMEAAFAAGFLARMNADAAAALFSNLSPEKAYALSVLMAGRNANAATE